MFKLNPAAMTSFYDSYDYYKKMLQLQEKLRKSEEERIRLEGKFKVLVQESRSRHDACINRLRLRYIEFLEEQRARDERNHKLLEALDRVDNSLALMTAKTDRLNELRKQYEAYLHRIYTTPSSSSIVATDRSKDRFPATRRDAEQQTPSSEITLPSTLSPDLFRCSENFQADRATTKFAKPMQTEGSSVTPLRLSNQQTNGSQITLRAHPSISQNVESILSPGVRDLQNYQRASSGQLISSGAQNILPGNLDRALAERDFKRGQTWHFPEQIRATVTPQKCLDVSQNRFTSLAYSPFHQGNEKISQVQVSTPVYKTMTLSMMESSRKYNNFTPVSQQRTSPSHFEYSWRKTEDYIRAKEKSLRDSSRGTMASDVDTIMRRHSRFVPKAATSGRPWNDRQIREEEEYRTTRVVENELDRYIDKIRRLHRDLDAQSLEELEREDASLSDKSLDVGRENLVGVEKVLALADELATRTVDARDSGNVETVENTRNVDTRMIDEGRGSCGLGEDKISGSIKLHEPELDTHENIEKSGKEDVVSEGDALPGQLAETQRDAWNIDFDISSEDRKNAEAIMAENLQRAELEVDQSSFEVVQELESWDLDFLQRRVKEMNLVPGKGDGIVEGELVTDVSVLKQDDNAEEGSENKIETEKAKKETEEVAKEASKEDSKKDANVMRVTVNSDGMKTDELREQEDGAYIGQGEVSESKSPTEMRETADLQEQITESYNNDKSPHVDPRISKPDEHTDEQKEPNLEYETKNGEEGVTAVQNAAYSEENYYENSGHPGDYPEDYGGYNYDENVAYENDQSQSYEGQLPYETNQREYCDLNATYGANQEENAYENNQNAEYQEYPNEEYAQGSSEQYGEYVGEQYNYEDQYVNDVNAEYQEVSNQQYEYSYEQQYEAAPNEAGDGNVSDQVFEYSEYDVAQNQPQINQKENEQREEQEEVEEPKGESKKVEGQKNERVLSEEGKKKKDVIKSLLDSDTTDSTIERNVSNTESDFDFN